jgi:hypothetical protein
MTSAQTLRDVAWIVPEFVNRHVLQHLMTAPIAGNRLLAERVCERIQSKV